MRILAKVFSWYAGLGNGPMTNMSDHKFKVGQTVTYLSGSIGRAPRHVFKIKK